MSEVISFTSNSGAHPGIFYGGVKGAGGVGGPNFGSERTVEFFCGKFLLTETTTCFSICERRSPLAREILLCEQGKQIIGGYPKTITFLNITGI